jgi:hypothetical protein
VVDIHPNIKAVFLGFSLFILSSILAFTLLLVDSAADIAQIFWPSLLLAGAVTAYSAKSFRIVFGIVLAVPCAIGFGLENLAWEQWYLHARINPIEDFVLVLITTLPYTLGLCASGALLGWAIFKAKEKKLFEHFADKPKQAKLEHMGGNLEILSAETGRK